ncbi:MAG: NYN domain-containing protein, partial [Clostridiales bacterium]|nr:NYN domain-containing protein [Clostridiales bacterium]
MKHSKKYVLVDGYNIIHSWGYLSEGLSLEESRDRLISVLQNYRGFSKSEVIVVFDAHLVKGGCGGVCEMGNIKVVYTKETETADHYIERASRTMAKEYTVTVATSDNLEQLIILGSGAIRISAEDFLKEVNSTEKKIKKKIEENRPVKNNQLL